MATLRPLQSSFLAGQISELLIEQVGTELYRSGCLQLLNVIVLRQGVVTRRPGTVYVATSESNARPWLVPFVYAENDAYCLAFTPLKLRFYRAHATITSGGSPYELTTVYTADDLANIRFQQVHDLMFLVDGAHYPQVLTRSGHTSWTIADAAIEDGPFLDENIEETTITPDATTGTISLAASVDVFESGHVGSYWQLRHRKAESKVSQSFTATGVSSQVYGGRGSKWEFVVSGSWSGTAVLQISYDNGSSWQDHYTVSSTSASIVNERQVAPEAADEEYLLRANVTSLGQGPVQVDVYVRAYLHAGVVKITAVSDGQNATATVIATLADTTATKRWSEGAWSTKRGFPRVVFGVDGRVGYASTTYQPLGIWMSETRGYTFFVAGLADDDAFGFELARAQQNRIQWVASTEFSNLLVGTTRGIIPIPPADQTKGYTPSNLPRQKRMVNVSVGSAAPVYSESAGIFLTRAGTRVHELVYSLEEDGLLSPDITLRCPEIVGTGLVGVIHVEEPEPMVWTWAADGRFPACTYSRSYQHAAWHDHATDGEVVSMIEIPVSGGDEVWMAVKRTINGTDRYFIEYMGMLDRGANEDGDYVLNPRLEDCKYLDASLTWDGGDAVEISGVTAADPVVVTLSSWPSDGDGNPLADGHTVKIRDIDGAEGVEGMEQLNDLVFTVSDADSGAKTLQLKSIDTGEYWDTSGYAAYVSGGTLERVAIAFDGLDHFANHTISCLTDGIEHDDVAIDGDGETELVDYFNTVHFGLGYTSVVEPMPFETPATVSTRKSINSLTVSFWHSIGMEAGPSLSDTKEIEVPRELVDGWTSRPQMFTGRRSVKFNASRNKYGRLVIVQRKPLPMTIRAIAPKLDVSR